MFAPNWTVKGEYLYYDLGHVSVAPPPLTVTVGGTVFTAIGISVGGTLQRQHCPARRELSFLKSVTQHHQHPGQCTGFFFWREPNSFGCPLLAQSERH